MADVMRGAYAARAKRSPVDRCADLDVRTSASRASGLGRAGRTARGSAHPSAPGRRGRVSTAPPWRVDGQGYVRVPAEGEAAGTPLSASSAILDGFGAGPGLDGGGASSISRLRPPWRDG